MKNRPVFVIVLVLLLTNVVTLGMWLWNQEDDLGHEYTVELDTKEPVAKVDGEKITYQEWLRFLEKQYGEKALKDMINTQVLKKLAADEKLSIDDGVLQLELSLLFTMEGILTEEMIKEKEVEWTEEVKERLYLEELFTQDVNVTEQEIQSYYDQYKGQYHFSPSIQLSHIVVENDATAKKVINELENGASFAALARDYTIDRETRDDGGYLGYYTSTSSLLPDKYYQQSQQLEEHTYSKPFDTMEGTAIIYLHRSLPEVKLSYDQLHAHLRREIALEKMKNYPDASKLWDKLNVDWIYQ